MKVLVIPEDQHLDQYIVKPVVECIFAELKRPAAITVLPEPRLRGTSDALNPEVIRTIVDENRGMTDLFILLVDRDCNREKNEAKLAARIQENADVLVGALAHQELECWMLALAELAQIPGAKSWSDVREDCDPKERYAAAFLRDFQGPGGGRKAAMRALSGKWPRLKQLCPEVGKLTLDVKAWLERS